METIEFNLGDKITVDYELYRKEEHVRESLENPNVTRVKRWEKTKLGREVEVTVIGIRTLSNGTTWYEQDYGYCFIPKKHFRALLVVESLHRKPFFIFMPENKKSELFVQKNINSIPFIQNKTVELFPMPHEI